MMPLTVCGQHVVRFHYLVQWRCSCKKSVAVEGDVVLSPPSPCSWRTLAFCLWGFWERSGRTMHPLYFPPDSPATTSSALTLRATSGHFTSVFSIPDVNHWKLARPRLLTVLFYRVFNNFFLLRGYLKITTINQNYHMIQQPTTSYIAKWNEITTSTCEPLFIVALFVTAKNGNNLSTHQLMKG